MSIRFGKLGIAANGCVVDPAIHDADLIGVFVPTSKRALIVLRDVHGTIICMELVDVERFRANDFRQGNVVLDITVHRGASVQVDDVAYVHELDVGSANDDSVLSKVMERIRQHELCLVQLSPSYGCEFTCLCKDIRVVAGWNALEEIVSGPE